MFWLWFTRNFIFVFTIICAIIVLGLCGRIVYVSNKYLGGYFPYAALGIATSVLTLITVPFMLFIDFVTTGFFTSMILVEIIWLSVLWILWLSTGATASSHMNSWWDRCWYWYGPAHDSCIDTRAVEAFAYMTWIALMCYVFVLCAMAAWGVDDPGVWTSSVKETFDDRTPVNQYPMASYPVTGMVVSQPQMP